MATTSFSPHMLCIPTWSIDWMMYQRLCLYLGLTPSPVLYRKVGQYLLQIATTQPTPKGFSRWLAELRPVRWTMGFVDVWTRLLMPSHPWRYRFNAVIAIHECDPQGFGEMMERNGGRGEAWISTLFITVTLILNLVLGLIWLCGQACAYTFSRRHLLREESYFKDTTVLVTGANRGLGLALLARLLSLGANVVAIVRERSLLSEQITKAGLSGRVHVIVADVANPRSLEAAMVAAGLKATQIDTAIINAGIKEEPAQDDGVASMRRVFGVNVFGAMQTVEALLQDWRTRGNGHFIFISSMGRWHGMAKTGTYNASKAALSLLAESMAIDFKVDGTPICITIIEPGLIRTGMIEGGILQNSLSVSTETAARRILQCASTKSGVCRFPLPFALMTAMIASLPFNLRIKLLGGIRSKNEGTSQVSK
jgi:NAD(P)-dependent dehydrogenase (short-subunit alcohol dehydrogenase family)